MDIWSEIFVKIYQISYSSYQIYIFRYYIYSMFTKLGLYALINLPQTGIISKQNQMECSTLLFCTLPNNPSLKSRVKWNMFWIKTLISTLGLIASIKNIKLNIRENIIQCCFYKINNKILRLFSKPPPHTFANSPPKCQCWFRKTKTVIYYYCLGG